MRIEINYERDQLLTEQGAKLVRDYYLQGDEHSPQMAFARAAGFFASNVEHAQRIYDAVSQQHCMFASPILSNAGTSGKGMPISCFLSYVPDTVEGLINHQSEVEWLSILGGGVGGHWGDVRAVDKKSPGPIPFVHSIDAAMTAYKQGETRKGAYVAYQDIDHPDIEEFLQIRVPTGGDVNRKCFNIHNAINVSDHFMRTVTEGGVWELKCPHSGVVRKEVPARELWEAILTTRHRTGEPYINFIDEANDKLHPAQKALGLSIKGSNLCNEIHLVTDELRTAVCCLTSLNLEKYDEWRDSGLVADLVEYLDNVLGYFIDTAPDVVSKARYATSRSRDIGIGAMGWHGYLMKNKIPFESGKATDLTGEIFDVIKAQAVRRSEELADERGSCPDAEETGYKARNLHLLAIAPNANSSIICNCTASIEPVNSNAYAHRTRAGTHLVVNKFLVDLLGDYYPASASFMGMSVEQWVAKQIELVVKADGSVQGLDYLSNEDKDIFKTFKEIDMHYVIEQAGVRQERLCQGQSVNLYFGATTEKAYINSVHLAAWKQKLKGLYYVRTGSVQKVSVSDEIIREAVGDAGDDECAACQA